ncbi:MULTISPECIES: TIGR03086 family metal-binding protein [unclassified Micromonospora]|uniref:TIGR03086 family metal-binding protein n=1 Tax=unclassified Micromonospora TaxID=2617518 RepID=UPI003321C4CB
MTASPPTSLADSVALFQRSVDYALGALSAVGDADLDRPTPCAGWDLRTLVLHLADSADALTDFAATGELILPASPRAGEADPVAVARERIQRLRDVVRTAVRGDPHSAQAAWAGGAARGGAIEFAAHGWDVVTACGTGREIPAGLASELLALSVALIGEQTREPRFGPSVPVASGATAGERLVAFLGRRPAARP